MGVRRNKGAARNAKITDDDTEPPPPPVPATPLPALSCCFKDEVASLPEDFHGHVPGHPESPGRVASCVERLRSCGLLRSFRRLPQRSASDEELLLCHSAEHVAGLEKLARLAAEDSKTRFVPTDGNVCMGGPCCEVREGNKDADTYVNPGSLRAARLAAGGVMQLVDEVMTEECSTGCGLALCRPPGHHASRTRSQGFCLVNNVAVAAAYARSQYPELQRVMIFDWDVHHGQGTQQIFDQSSDVLTLSIHRHDGENFYPATGGAREVGIGTGRGYSVNVPLPGGYGDAALWAACAEVLVPAARQFQPQLIIVSAGFDAAAGDPLGGCTVSTRFFGVLTMEMRRLARELSESRLVLALEGGYNLSVLEDCVEEVARALIAEAPEGMAFAESPPWPLEGSAYYGAIRRTCEAHQSLPLRLRPPASKSERRKAAGFSPKASIAGAEGGEAGGAAAAVRALGAAAMRGLGRFAGLGGSGASSALEAAVPETGEDEAADSAAATAEAAVTAVETATGPIATEAAAEAEAVQRSESPTRKSKSQRKAQKKAREAAQALESEPAQEAPHTGEDAAQLETAASLEAEPEAVQEAEPVQEAAAPEEEWTAPRQRRRKNEQQEMASDAKLIPDTSHEPAKAAADGSPSSKNDASSKNAKPAAKKKAASEVDEKVGEPAFSPKAEPRKDETPKAAKPATASSKKKAVSEIEHKALAPAASSKAEPRNGTAKKAPAPATGTMEKKAAGETDQKSCILEAPAAASNEEKAASKDDNEVSASEAPAASSSGKKATRETYHKVSTSEAPAAASSGKKAASETGHKVSTSEAPAAASSGKKAASETGSKVSTSEAPAAVSSGKKAASDTGPKVSAVEAPAAASSGKKAASETDHKVSAPEAPAAASGRKAAGNSDHKVSTSEAPAAASSRKKAASDSGHKVSAVEAPAAASSGKKAASEPDHKVSAPEAPAAASSGKKAASVTDHILSAPAVSSKDELRTTLAKSCPDPAPIHAVCEIQPNELVVRLSPVQRPKDIAVSSDELWVWFELGARRWRIEGVRVDNSGALRSAEFRSKRKELTLNLVLGPILGGAVLLTPLAVDGIR